MRRTVLNNFEQIIFMRNFPSVLIFTSAICEMHIKKKAGYRYVYSMNEKRCICERALDGNQ